MVHKILPPEAPALNTGAPLQNQSTAPMRHARAGPVERAGCIALGPRAARIFESFARLIQYGVLNGLKFGIEKQLRSLGIFALRFHRVALFAIALCFAKCFVAVSKQCCGRLFCAGRDRRISCILRVLLCDDSRKGERKQRCG